MNFLSISSTVETSFLPGSLLEWELAITLPIVVIAVVYKIVKSKSGSVGFKASRHDGFDLRVDFDSFEARSDDAKKSFQAHGTNLPLPRNQVHFSGKDAVGAPQVLDSFPGSLNQQTTPRAILFRYLDGLEDAPEEWRIMRWRFVWLFDQGMNVLTAAESLGLIKDLERRTAVGQGEKDREFRAQLTDLGREVLRLLRDNSSPQ